MAAVLSFLSFFLSPIGRYLAIGAVSVTLAGGAYIKGDLHGRAVVQGKWDAAVSESVQRGEQARKDAEQAVASAQALPSPGFARILPQRLRPHDRYDVDTGAVRPVAPDNVPLPKRRPWYRSADKNPQPSGADPALLGVSCAQVQWAIKNLPPATLADYKKNMTPAQAAAAAKCLKGK